MNNRFKNSQIILKNTKFIKNTEGPLSQTILIFIKSKKLKF
jgi:hypothetical protein